MIILLVEDDTGIVRFVKKGLEENAFSVEVASNGEEGLQLASHMKYDDLIVLDIMLPKMDGKEVLKKIRSRGIQTAVIFLTAKDSERDIVHGLNSGADDYLTKPFSFNELLARIKAIRRGKAVLFPSRIQMANLILEPEGHLVFREKQKIELTPKEYAILEFLMKHPGEIITRTMISQKIFDYYLDISTNVVDIHVSHLQNKIDENFKPKLLHTVKGVDYVLEDRG